MEKYSQGGEIYLRKFYVNTAIEYTYLPMDSLSFFMPLYHISAQYFYCLKKKKKNRRKIIFVLKSSDLLGSSPLI